jgi:alkanesulfonate monooxygenase SsuD/methylene tetrahydromethanopterin reductase-like flavin-dependent oxidoreductase (luciferase family)
VSLHDAQVRPVPVQTPHPPIWIGGSGPTRTLPLVARYADAWHSWGTPGSLAEPNARVSELAEAAGRNPGSILRASSLSLSDDDAIIRKYIAKWQGAGWGYLVCGWPEEGAARVEHFATEVMPEFT